jgi:tRNA(Ile)-lysidine synthetase-like protein
MKHSNLLDTSVLNQAALYVVAVSFGPDSMALLDTLRRQGYRVHVAHVNYHKRPESDVEQSRLEQYCIHHDIPLSVLDVNDDLEGNFQQAARIVRYNFFKDIALEQKAEAILTAHHLDDHLETAMMQLERGSLHERYGIRQQSAWQGVKVLRPFLAQGKKALIEYCKLQQVPHSIDATNATPVYTRNRHRLRLQKLASVEKRQLLKRIQNLNQDQLNIQKKLTLWKNKHTILTSLYASWTTQTQFLYWHMKSEHQGFHMVISHHFLQKVMLVIQSQKPNVRVKLNNDWFLEKSYDRLIVLNNHWLVPYEYSVNNSVHLSHPLFEFDFKGGVPIPTPFVCRSAKATDYIQIRHYKSSFRRLAIDWKMPLYLRSIWPVMVDSKDRVKFIPRYQNGYESKANNWLVIIE